MFDAKRIVNSIKKIETRERVKKETRDVCILIDNDELLLISNQKYLTARQLDINHGVNTYVVTNKKNGLRRAMADAYGFTLITLSTINLLFFFKSVICAVHDWLVNDYENLLYKKIGDIDCGDLLYDTLIMRMNKTYTINNLRNWVSFRELFLIYYMYYKYTKLFKNLNPRYFIAEDLVYRDGFVTRLAIKAKCKIIILTTGRPSYCLTGDTIGKNIGFSDLYRREIKRIINDLPSDWEIELNEKLYGLFSGSGDWNARNAYQNKVVTDRSSILNDIGIDDDGRKIVVIMAHCFSDAPHANGISLYKDYYSWFKKTVEIASGIDKVHWLIKPHPSRYQYQEGGVAEDIFLKFKNENIYWMPDKYSTKMVVDIADCIITVCGSAGMELTCVGIPCINAGRTWYMGFGYTINPETREEYESLLREVSTIERLTENQMMMAKKVYYAFNKIWHIEDKFSQSCYSIHQEYCVERNVEKANQKYVELFSEYVDSNKIDDIYDIKFADNIM